MNPQVVASIVIAAIGSAGLVLAAVIPVLLSTRNKASAAASRAASAASTAVEAREAITNGHTEHVRVAMDRQHVETLKAIDDVRREVGRDIGGLRVEIRQEREDRGRLEDRVGDLEKTKPGRQRPE